MKDNVAEKSLPSPALNIPKNFARSATKECYRDIAVHFLFLRTAIGNESIQPTARDPSMVTVARGTGPARSSSPSLQEIARHIYCTAKVQKRERTKSPGSEHKDEMNILSESEHAVQITCCGKRVTLFIASDQHSITTPTSNRSAPGVK